MKRGRGFGASSKQRARVKEEPCVHCGRLGVDPAHLLPRSRGGCDDPLCVVPLCRKCHEAFDRHELDLLSFLLSAGCFDEIAHIISAHRLSPLSVLEHLTASQWEPLKLGNR